MQHAIALVSWSPQHAVGTRLIPRRMLRPEFRRPLIDASLGDYQAIANYDPRMHLLPTVVHSVNDYLYDLNDVTWNTFSCAIFIGPIRLTQVFFDHYLAPCVTNEQLLYLNQVRRIIGLPIFREPAPSRKRNIVEIE